MTGTEISSDGLDERRKRLLFRSWHRGIREMDLVYGRFADAHIADLSATELAHTYTQPEDYIVWAKEYMSVKE